MINQFQFKLIHSFTGNNKSFPDTFMDKDDPIGKLRDKWDYFSDVYEKLDAGPQAFYFTLVNMLKLHRANNFLQIGCGAGHLLSYAIATKKKECQYVATDLSPEMVAKAETKLKKQLDLFRSQFTAKEFLEENKVVLKAWDGELPVEGYGKFDRVVCNLVLMLTNDAKKMLKSIHESCAEGAKLGITIWGNKASNNFLTLLGRALNALGLPPPKDRSPFYLTQLIDNMAVECGWEVDLSWEQTATFPLVDREDMANFVKYQVSTMDGYSKEDAIRVGDKIMSIFEESIASKTPMIMSNRLMILRKK